MDEGVNDNYGPYVFKISGQISHKIGSLCPYLVKRPRFLQLYLFNPENEVSNRFRVFDSPRKRILDEGIVMFLVAFLRANNEYARTFKTEKDLADEMNIASYFVRFFNNVPDRRYDLPSPGSLGCLVSGDDINCTRYDIIVLGLVQK